MMEAPQSYDEYFTLHDKATTIMRAHELTMAEAVLLIDVAKLMRQRDLSLRDVTTILTAMYFAEDFPVKSPYRRGYQS